MEAAELACTREFLGLSVRWLSEYLGVSERQLQRMEDGKEPIHGRTADNVDDLAVRAFDVMCVMIKQPKVLVRGHKWITYRTDADAREGGIACAPTGVPYPASWHRALVARCQSEVGGGITYYVPRSERT